MHRKKVNKTRYDDPRKPMKLTSFTVKNLGGNLPEKKSTIVKRSFRSSTKLLSLDSTIPIDELTSETFYRFRTFELFNIWTLPFFRHESQYVTNFFARIPVRDSLTNLKKMLVAKFFTSQQWRSRSTWLQNPKAHKKRSKNFFFYRRRLGFQKENLMKLSRVVRKEVLKTHS